MFETTCTKKFLSEKQVAQRLGVSKVTVRRWRWSGRECPPHIRVGTKLVKYPAAEFEAWLDAMRAGEIVAGTPKTQAL
ncbi:MAG: helix-turn-helix domain-containing protein [Bryobacter sp.]|jgi:excisionase family DNA binding protein|nr:helix-turn-helix domain-containing protein [Bryobacter sp. CoA8 C33]